MTEYEKGFADAREKAAQVACEYWTGIIRCGKTGATIDHIMTHVEWKWAQGVAALIRTIKS